MNILLRLPNWLGDIVMSTAFIDATQKIFPESTIAVIVKKELSGIMNFINPDIKVYAFSKKEHPGIKGAMRFGQMIKSDKRYDLFISLPDSFSSAWMGYFTGCKTRIGYKKDFRGLLLTHSYTHPKGKHRVEDYLQLLELYKNISIENSRVQLKNYTVPGNGNNIRMLPEGKNLVLNINSEAQSRRMPLQLAESIGRVLLDNTEYNIILTGSPKEMEYNETFERMLNSERVYNFAGKTSLSELLSLIAQSDRVISTDSGIAHVAGALQKKMVVLFGAGNELSTGPYNSEPGKVFRVPGLDCAPCISNTCKFGEPKCLTMMNADLIVKHVLD